MLAKIIIFVTLFSKSSQYIYTSVQKTKELVAIESEMIQALGKLIEQTNSAREEIPDEVIQSCWCAMGIRGRYGESTIFDKGRLCWIRVGNVGSGSVYRADPYSSCWFYRKTHAHNQKALLSPGFIENPLNSFHFFKRMCFGWTRIISTLNCDNCPETVPLKSFNDQISSLDKKFGSLTALEDDFKGAAAGIIRLKKTYKLKPRGVILGKILDEQYEELSPDDVHTICNLLDDLDQFKEEVNWLEDLLHLLPPTNTGMTKVVRQLASALWKIGHQERALALLTKQRDIDPSNNRLEADLEFYHNKYGGNPDASGHALSPTDEPSDMYETLCRGEGSRDIRTISELGCVYRKTTIPIYVAKEEIMSIDPRVSVVYNVIHESELNLIKQIAASKLEDSSVIAVDGQNIIVTKTRVSQTAWLTDVDHPVVHRVSRRVQLISGLSTELANRLPHAEQLQVLNYGFGGMYVPHLDVINVTMFPGSKDESGDRMATWMFYLNDVKAGGATVFPLLNITVPVTKGAAAFWYNIKRNGERDDRLKHAGCPVLLGSKWVANKWIRETGQIFRRKCGKTFESIDGLVDAVTMCSRNGR